MSTPATIQRILSVDKHPDADTLSIAKVLGYNVVIKTGEHQAGDLVIYVEPDSKFNPDPRVQFLEGKQWRIRSLKLRGIVSQGLILKMKDFDIEGNEGDEVSEKIGVFHFEKAVPESCNFGIPKGQFPSFMSKTDECSLQSSPATLEVMYGQEIYKTVKADGSSATFYIKGDDFGVCSRNLELKETEDSQFWQLARKYKIEEALRSLGGNWSLQAEFVGPGCQGNKMKLAAPDLRVFNLYSIDRRELAGLTELLSFCSNFQIPMVDIIWRGVLNREDHSLDKLLEMANKLEYAPGIPAEGIVIRPVVPMRDYRGNRVSGKVISQKFLLKHNE